MSEASGSRASGQNPESGPGWHLGGAPAHAAHDGSGRIVAEGRSHLFTVADVRLGRFAALWERLLLMLQGFRVAFLLSVWVQDLGITMLGWDFVVGVWCVRCRVWGLGFGV